MGQIKHSHVQIRGQILALIYNGFLYPGPKVVLFPHGFPEIWYTWRHQMIVVADAGYGTIAMGASRSFFLASISLARLMAKLDHFGRLEIKTVIRNICILFSGAELPIARDDQEIMDLVDPSTPLTPWFSEQDLAVYSSLIVCELRIPFSITRVDCGETSSIDCILKMPGVKEGVKEWTSKEF
ncbi:uncharacterized protein LOC110668205 [Hevea brasiliensis]|uniref:uncharacterized protein LOC110668205 n=1 Tax=Hevea brasiliensis TaxID=3981 RepID=UPI000B7793A2|nr:uncharacterized protein LOC110668205 [Hevea brasiliensis]